MTREWILLTDADLSTPLDEIDNRGCGNLMTARVHGLRVVEVPMTQPDRFT